MHKEKAKISCEIFQKQEPIIKDITDKINNTKDVQEKAVLASELQKEVNILFSCPDRKATNLDCTNCHFITNLRKKTADLIIKAKKLSEA